MYLTKPPLSSEENTWSRAPFYTHTVNSHDSTKCHSIPVHISDRSHNVESIIATTFTYFLKVNKILKLPDSNLLTEMAQCLEGHLARRWHTEQKYCFSNLDLVHQLPARFIATEILCDNNCKSLPEMRADEAKLVDPKQLANDDMDMNADDAVARQKPMPYKAKKMNKSTEVQKAVEDKKSSSFSSSLSSSSSSSSIESSTRKKKKKKKKKKKEKAAIKEDKKLPKDKDPENHELELTAVEKDTPLGVDEDPAKEGAAKVVDNQSRASTSNKITSSSRSCCATNPSDLSVPHKKCKTLDDLMYWDFWCKCIGQFFQLVTGMKYPHDNIYHMLDQGRNQEAPKDSQRVSVALFLCHCRAHLVAVRVC